MAARSQKIAAATAVAALLLCMSSCADVNDGFTLCNGDLLFQVGAESQMGGAIQDATARGDAVPYTHAAVAEVGEEGTVQIIEATGERGVCRTELADFLDRSARIDGRPAVTVYRVTTGTADAAELDAAVERAAGFIGQPYDWMYMPDNGRMYCTELIYESFLRADGSHIFTARPMNFRAADGSMPQFWTELFGSMGMPIPEGAEGTNPADMSREECIEQVYSYF